MPINLLNTKDKVKLLLEKHDYLRDNDSALVARIWSEEMEYANMSSIDVLKKIASNTLTPFESVRRCRQKLQELYPELRGNTYNERHNRQEDIKQELNQFLTP